MNTAPHAPNAATVPDAENMTSMRQLLDGQEYPVAKCDIIKKGFESKAAVEKCMAYLHGFYQLPGCPRHTGNIIKSCTCVKQRYVGISAIHGRLPRDTLQQKEALYIHFISMLQIYIRE